MALSFGGSGFSAQKSISYMSQTKSDMDKSLLRLSSGKRIHNAGDDPGGLAVSMRLQNEISILGAAKDRVANSKSYVEAQSTALQSVADIVSEMQTIKTNYDATANASEKAAYESQFQDLRGQLASLKGETINGEPLFNRGSNLTISTSTDGSSGSVTLTDIDLAAAFQYTDGDGNSADLADLTQTITLDDSDANFDASFSNLSDIHDTVSGLVTEVAGDESTLGFANDYLENMSTNLEAAHGRIMDVDIAEESANYAKLSMQYEAAAAAVAQANVAMGAVLDLLLTSINRD
jgi:flagellin